MIGSVMERGSVSMIHGGWQWRHDCVPILVSVYCARRWRRSRTVSDRRRRWFVIVTMVVMVTLLLLLVVMVVVVVFMMVMLIVVVGVTKVRRNGGAAIGRHDVHRGRRQRRRHSAVRAVHRAQRTRPVLGRCALSSGGSGGGDGRGRGSGAPRLVVDVILVELHGGGGGARSTDDHNGDYYYYGILRGSCRRRRSSATATAVSSDVVYKHARANAMEKCCFSSPRVRAEHRTTASTPTEFFFNSRSVRITITTGRIILDKSA